MMVFFKVNNNIQLLPTLKNHEYHEDHKENSIQQLQKNICKYSITQ